MSEIEKRLLKDTQLNVRKEYEDRQDYLAALVRAVNVLPDEKYDVLPDAAVSWCNKGIDALRNKKRIPDFPDLILQTELLEEPEATAETVEAVAEPEQPKPERKKRPKGQPPKVLETKPIEHSDEYVTDKWGLMIGSKASAAADLFEKGARMSDVKETLGSTQYNLLKRLTKKGHVVETVANGIIKLVYVER